MTTLRSDSETGTAESLEGFVHRQNIHRCRRLLETERDDRKRQTLLTMLSQEENETKECKVAESLRHPRVKSRHGARLRLEPAAKTGVHWPVVWQLNLGNAALR